MKVLIYIENKEGNPLSGSLEIIGAANTLGAETHAVIIGSNVSSAAEQVAAYGAAVEKYTAAEPISDELIAEVIYSAAYSGKYDLVAAASTSTSKSVLPSVAGRLSAGYVSDAVMVENEDGSFLFTRPAYGGTVFETRRVKGTAVATFRAGSYEKPVAGEAKAAPIDLSADISVSALRTAITDIIADTSNAVDIESAKIVVCVGRGLAGEADFALVQDLADALGAVMGGSRPIIEEGLLPRQQQVGQSGKIVNPDLYIGVGVSGAPQHIAGMAGSKYIVSINKDEEAPIFGVSDLGIVGDARKILPFFTEEIKKYRSEH